MFTRTRTTPCPVNVRPPPYSPRPAEQNKTLRSSLARTFRAMFARGNVCAVCRCLVVHQGAFVPHCHSPSLVHPLSLSLAPSSPLPLPPTTGQLARSLTLSRPFSLSHSLTHGSFRPFSFSSRPLRRSFRDRLARSFVRSFVCSFLPLPTLLFTRMFASIVLYKPVYDKPCAVCSDEAPRPSRIQWILPYVLRRNHDSPRNA